MRTANFGGIHGKLGGVFSRLGADGTPVPMENERFATGAKSPWAAEALGFDVHAGATVRAGDRDGLERFLRYCARPPFSVERLSLLPDGRIAYLLRKPRRMAPRTSCSSPSRSSPGSRR